MKMYTVNREELAWAAGFFDGEGCTGFYSHSGDGDKHKRMKLVMSIAQINRETLEKFNRIIGGYGRICTYKTTNVNWKPRWQLAINGLKNCQFVITLLWQWLSEPKRKQAEEALKAAIKYNRLMQYQPWARKMYERHGVI
jgi:hypothetical protein